MVRYVKMTFTTQTTVLLSIAGICFGYGIWEEASRWLIRQKIKKAKLNEAYEHWIEITDRYAEWRAENTFQNFENPHAQWFIRKELAAFSSYLDLKKKRTRPETDYLAELRRQILNVLHFEPPKA